MVDWEIEGRFDKSEHIKPVQNSTLCNKGEKLSYF